MKKLIRYLKQRLCRHNLETDHERWNKRDEEEKQLPFNFKSPYAIVKCTKCGRVRYLSPSEEQYGKSYWED